MTSIGGFGRAGGPAFDRESATLFAADSSLRRHELDHQLAGRGVVGAATFRTERGPDGRLHLVAGRVSASITPGLSPEDTAKQARQIRDAALAPGDPSSEDSSAAGAATAVAVRAEGEVAARERARRENGGAPLDGIAADLFQLAVAAETGVFGSSRIDVRA